MKHQILLIFSIIVTSHQSKPKPVHNLEGVVESLRRLRQDVATVCNNVSLLSFEEYRQNEYRLVLQNVDPDVKVAVKVQDLVLEVNVPDAQGLNVVRLLPPDVDVSKAYYTNNRNILEVVVPYSKSVMNVDCYPVETKTDVVSVPERLEGYIAVTSEPKVIVR